ncbi:related to Gim complex component GIM1 [Rhynchosporium graminicola]|uniref:Related to Gim complex component GIM1 n=1 Tax=Rhynchosporium graminicola TaxID=2792576 RepID=A0A1E1KTI4_9HELO|nr:related to Gim complex component GIM1 [Rhynchosporium commune]
MAAEAQQKLQSLTDEYQKLQQDLQKNVNSRQRLESQQQENKAVQKEFDGLKDDANIYKMVGPVLLKLEKTEAVMAVNGRLEFIENEIKRVEKQISDVESKSDEVRQQIIQIQSEAQPQAGQPQIAA